MSFTLDVFTISFFSGTFFISLYIFHIFLFTNIHNLSISPPHSLALFPIYLSPSLSSARFTVTLQTCKLSPSLSLAHSLGLTSHPHPLYCLLFWTQRLCLSLSLSLLLHPLSVTLSLPPLSHSIPPSLFLILCISLYLSVSLSMSISLIVSLPPSHNHFCLQWIKVMSHCQESC